MATIRITLLLPGHVHNPVMRDSLLSAIGRIEARERRRTLGDPAFDLALYPPLAYAHESARIISGLHSNGPMVQLEELGHPEGDHGCHEVVMQTIRGNKAQNVLIIAEKDTFLALGYSLTNNQLDSFRDVTLFDCGGFLLTSDDGGKFLARMLNGSPK